MLFLRPLLSALALVLVIPSTIQAGIIEATGDIVVIPPPTSVRDQDLLSDSLIYAFIERTGVVLPRSLTFNITQPGASPGASDINTSPGELAAGTPIDSYFVHFESISGTHANPVLVSGSIKFNRDVLGIAVFNRRLDESDEALGFASTLYPSDADRELEINVGGIVGIDGNDSITLSDDRRTVSLSLGNTAGLDQIRIVTAVPEASSLALAGVGAATVAIYQLRRRCLSRRAIISESSF